MEAVLTRLAEQIPVALLVSVILIWFIRDQQKAQALRDAARDESQAMRDKAVQLSMDKRDELMRQFWSGQQTSNRDVLERLIVSVDKVAERLDEHDGKTDVAIAAMFERTSEKRDATQPTPTRPRKRSA